ncbi:MAG: hypothetical protein ACYTGG_01545 [Planctomycetota bacterium]|jgi:hypothetical protein
MSGDPFDSIHDARTAFGAAARAKKHRLLAQCAAHRLPGLRRLKAYHDTLLYLAAHPDDRCVLDLVEAELQRLARSLDGHRGPIPASLLNSGIAGSHVESSFTIDSIRWLLRRFPGDVEIAWEDGSAGEALDAVLPWCIVGAEQDGLLDARLSTRDWFDLATGGGCGRALQWLIERVETWACPAALRDHLFESLDVPVRWRLVAPDASITFARFPARAIAFQRQDLRRRVSLPRLVAKDLPSVVALPRRAANQLIDIARIVLATRQRETDPVTYANPDEVTLVGLERGIDVALFGLQPDRRLPIETFVGYVAARNRVPVAYGGAWIFFDRAEIGINVFDAFRRGESALLFAQIIRVYHRHFGVRRFRVDPFQFGAGNAEGIRSGAYWFYHRLGFRSVDPDLAAVADAEAAKVKADRSYRCPASVLRRMTKARLFLDLHRRRGRDLPELTDLGLAVTRAMGSRFEGDRGAATTWARRRLRRTVGRLDTRRWSEAEQAALDSLGILVALVPDLDQWPAAARRSLVPLLRAKGGRRERDYVRAMQRHPRLGEALTSLAHCSAT